MTQPSLSRAPVALAVFGLAAAASLALPLSAAAADKAAALAAAAAERAEMDVRVAALAEAASQLRRSQALSAGMAETLTSIMLAQDFQDLSGQVIQKVIDIITRTELQLVQLLVDSSPDAVLAEAEAPKTPVTVDTANSAAMKATARQNSRSEFHHPVISSVATTAVAQPPTIATALAATAVAAGGVAVLSTAPGAAVLSAAMGGAVGIGRGVVAVTSDGKRRMMCVAVSAPGVDGRRRIWGTEPDSSGSPVGGVVSPRRGRR